MRICEAMRIVNDRVRLKWYIFLITIAEFKNYNTVQ